ncbi:hypothetical protein ACFWTE_27855 [Nocardiopsis sp. NPDC058631]|uniref:hypothetical protein n=1 Tax=Nocardiopsis sp. NPDC058631 TaxID=3346566 RepID=UPI00364E0EF9
MPDSPQPPGGYEYPEEPAAVGGYEPPQPRPRPLPPPETTVRPVEDGEDGPLAAAERFRRTTPARLRTIPPHRSGGHWRLLAGTLTYVMVVGGMADYVEPGVRAIAHLVFWLLIGVAFLVTIARERRHGWEPAPRWPWTACAVGAALAVEGLILAFGSPAIIVGSAILLGLGLFVLMLVG